MIPFPTFCESDLGIIKSYIRIRLSRISNTDRFFLSLGRFFLVSAFCLPVTALASSLH